MSFAISNQHRPEFEPNHPSFEVRGPQNQAPRDLVVSSHYLFVQNQSYSIAEFPIALVFIHFAIFVIIQRILITKEFPKFYLAKEGMFSSLLKATGSKVGVFRNAGKPVIAKGFSQVYVNHRQTPANNDSTPFEFTEENFQQIQKLLSKYPSNYKKSAVIPALFIAQK